MVEESKTSGTMLQDFNSTFLTLISKEHEANKEYKYKPISLCNVIYKIFSKVVSNHLNPIMNLVISPEKGRFAEGGQILDDIILSHESIHSLKRNKFLMALSISMSLFILDGIKVQT